MIHIHSTDTEIEIKKHIAIAKFQSKRWLKSDGQSLNPAPQLAVFELLRRFRVEWAGEGQVECVSKLANYPDRKLVFKFVEI